MNVCPNCGNAILGHPKECAICKFDLEKFELLTEEEQNLFKEYKYQERLKENPDIYVKRENPYEELFKEQDFKGIVLGICSLVIGSILGVITGSFGAFVGVVLGVIGLIFSIDAAKSYSHEVGFGFVICIIGTVFSVCLFFGWTFGNLDNGYYSNEVSCVDDYHHIKKSCDSFYCPG